VLKDIEMFIGMLQIRLYRIEQICWQPIAEKHPGKYVLRENCHSFVGI